MKNFELNPQSRDAAPLENGAELDFQKSNLPSMEEVRRREAELGRHYKLERSQERMTVFTEVRTLGARVSWARGRKADESRPLNAQTDLGTTHNYEFTGRQS